MTEDNDCRDEFGPGSRRAPPQPPSARKMQGGEGKVQRTTPLWQPERVHPQWRR